MRRLGAIIIGGLLLAAGLAASPTLAKTPRPTLLYPTSVDLHFADAKGRVHTIAIGMYGQPTDAQPCPKLDEVAAKALVADRAPELHVMTYIGSTCHGAKFPSHVDVKPEPPDSRPAVIVLFYRADDGGYHYSLFGDKRAGDYLMGTCPLVLKQTQAALVKQVESNHTGQKFLGANCFMRNASTLIHFPNK